ncbi:DUF7511 domain-containing protein [Natrinema saccharevitans]|uniref:DUF7511 domain-containing protein n=1 Tax=Natrinema saccharevitans TaxID=301967 RepID=UPI001115A52D|nr:hypothetical protein [Natrinema saccharevitans]
MSSSVPDSSELVSRAAPRFKSAHVENDDYPDEFAIFDASSVAAMTQTWLAASGDGFVDLDEAR